jgi:hypothetical protein
MTNDEGMSNGQPEVASHAEGCPYSNSEPSFWFYSVKFAE